MENRPNYKGIINGELDIFVVRNEEQDESSKMKISWDELMIHGDPEGLKSLAKLLTKIADLNQENIDEQFLPNGAKEYCLN